MSRTRWVKWVVWVGVVPLLLALLWTVKAPAQDASSGFDLKGVVAQVSPSVVRVSCEMMVRRGTSRLKVTRQASGVILTDDGLIVTQNGAVAEQGVVSVLVAGQDRVPAKVVLRDVETDLVWLKVDLSGLKTIPLGDATKVYPGQAVLHIGNPFGLALGKNDELSVNHGVINSIYSLDGSGKRYQGKVIQTDAGFNPGGYGGALVNLKGELIGVASAVITSRLTNTEINYAIPVDELKRQLKLAQQELAHPTTPTPVTPGPSIPEPGPAVPEKPRPPRPDGVAKAPGYLGAYILEEDSSTRGAYIERVVPGSPAEVAGLRAGDLVQIAAGHEVKNGSDLLGVLDTTGEGDTLKLTVERQGVRFEREVKLGKVPGRVLR